jgi:hypothetical protein
VYAVGMAYTTTFTAPPVPGTQELTWEGWVRADELLPCDITIGGGSAVMIEALSTDHDGQVIVIVGGVTAGTFCPDEALYIERRVKLTVALD